MDLIPFRGLRRNSHWPSIWDDLDSSVLSTNSNNLDVYETEDEIVVKANVAGVKPDNVDLTYEDGVLWIEAKKTEESNENKQHYCKSSWSYSYKIAVPGKIDLAQDPTAEVEDGILTVIFSKSEASKPRKVKVKAK